MDRNSIIGLLVIAAIVIIWGIVNKPSQEEIERAKRERDSLQRAKQEQVDNQQQTQPERKPQEEVGKTPAAGEQETTTRETGQKNELEAQYGSFASAADGEEKFIIMENKKKKAKF